MEEPKTIVTKQKNPNRVAAGKRVAEYNKRNKEQKQKMKEVTPKEDIPKEVTKEETNTPYYIFLGGLGLLSFGYIYKKFLQPKQEKVMNPKEPEKTKEEEPKVNKCDPFIME